MGLIGVYIDHYKSIRNTFIPLDGLTVLFGSNGTGKTNILEAVELALGGRRFDSFSGETPDPRGVSRQYWPKVMAVVHLSGEEFLNCLLHLRGWEAWMMKVLVGDEWGGGAETADALVDFLNSHHDPSLDQAIDFWSSMLAERGSGTSENRKRFARAMLEDRVFGIAEWMLYACASPSRLPPEIEAILDDIARDGVDEDHLGMAARRLRGLRDRDRQAWTPALPLWPIPPRGREPRPWQPALAMFRTDLRDLERDLNEAVRKTTYYLADPKEHLTALRIEGPESDHRRQVRDEHVVMDRWFDDSGKVKDAIAVTLGHIAAQATERLPSFLREWGGRVTLEVRGVEVWGQEPRIGVRFMRAGVSRPITELSAGQELWVAAAVRDTVREFLGAEIFCADGDGWRSAATSDVPVDWWRHEPAQGREYWDGWDDNVRFAISGRPVLRVIDEPEAHLHATAQPSVGEWLIERFRDHAERAIVATHSLEILDTVLEADVLLVSSDLASEEGSWRPLVPTRVERVRESLSSLESDAERYGLGPHHWISLLRGIVLVEGEHDKLVLEKFFGSELKEARLHVQPIRGVHNTRALAEAEFLRRLGKQMFALFDSVRPEALDGSMHRGRMTPEERALSDLKGEMPGVSFVVMPNPFKDIVLAIPDVHWDRVLQRGGKHFPGWDVIEGEFGKRLTKSRREKQVHKPDFKSVTLEMCGFTEKERSQFTNLLKTVLEDAETKLPHDSPLARAVKQILALSSGPISPRAEA